MYQKCIEITITASFSQLPEVNVSDPPGRNVAFCAKIKGPQKRTLNASTEFI